MTGAQHARVTSLPLPLTLTGARGLSLVEATIILAVISTLGAIMAPAINGYIAQSRQLRARQDVQVIGEAILSFIEDNAERMFLQNANGTTNDREPPTRADANRVNLLVSDGDVPAISLSETFWTQAVNGTSVDTLANHLIQNSPDDLDTTRYRNATDITNPTAGGLIDFARSESSGFNAPYSWRGGYLRAPVRPDPWGNRYAVNVGLLDPRSDTSPLTITGLTTGFGTSTYHRLDVFVLSAGPDQQIDTASAQDGAVPGDDDIIFIVSSHAK